MSEDETTYSSGIEGLLKPDGVNSVPFWQRPNVTVRQYMEMVREYEALKARLAETPDLSPNLSPKGKREEREGWWMDQVFTAEGTRYMMRFGKRGALARHIELETFSDYLFGERGYLRHFLFESYADAEAARDEWERRRGLK